MKIYKVVIMLGLIAVLVFGLNLGLTGLKTKEVVEQVKVTKQIDSELQRIMEEENFKKSTILRARKVANDNKKAIEVERNKKALDLIETEYESIRNEELLLTGDKSVSLK